MTHTHQWDLIANRTWSCRKCQMLCEGEPVREKLMNRVETYRKKRDRYDALAPATLNEWDKYNFAIEAIEWMAGELGIDLSEPTHL